MTRLWKFTLYFINSLFLYSIIGIVACNVPFPVLGMIFGAPSVLIAAFALAFARTLEMYKQGNCVIDFKEYFHVLIDIVVTTIVLFLIIAVIYVIYLCYFISSDVFFKFILQT